MAPPVVGTRAAIREALRTKSGLFGFGMLIFMLSVVVIIPFLAPYDVVRQWGDVSKWTDNPRNAKPDWIDAFSSVKEARNIIRDWGDFRSAESNWSGSLKVILLTTKWNFEWDVFPPDLRLELLSSWSGRVPQITVEWERPDNERVPLYEAAPERAAPNVETISLSSDTDVMRDVEDWAEAVALRENFTLDNVSLIRPHVTLYAQLGPGMLGPHQSTVLKGEYKLTIQVIAFGETDTVRARFTSYGTAFGLAGTDHLRRDLFIGLLWGAPVALAFGSAAAFITVMSQVILGALGAYFGGRFDEFIQRATDFLIILPLLPILILIAQLYSPNIVLILGIVIAFNIVGGTTKVVRSIALQVKEELHVEAARSYGASRLRILFRYVMPRTLPYSFALLSLSVPAFIFLEASLSFLGLGDPSLPTWGSIMGDAQRNGAIYNGFWWWIALPALGIVFATVAFAFLGYAFDKVLNPRLREE